MRCFDEEIGDLKNKPKETIVIISNSDSDIIYKAMEEYVKNNPKKVKAKALLKEMFEKWCFI